jgi:hypothetical protein
MFLFREFAYMSMTGHSKTFVNLQYDQTSHHQRACRFLLISYIDLPIQGYKSLMLNYA